MLGNGCRGNVSEPCRLCFCSGAPPILQVTGDLAGTQSSTNSAMLCARNPVPCAYKRVFSECTRTSSTSSIQAGQSPFPSEGQHARPHRPRRPRRPGPPVPHETSQSKRPLAQLEGPTGTVTVAVTARHTGTLTGTSAWNGRTQPRAKVPCKPEPATVRHLAVPPSSSSSPLNFKGHLL